jgi:hypothetical protein
MSTALVISLGAVAMSLFAVFMARRTSNSRKQGNKDGGSVTASSDSNGADCGPGDGGGCDGGGGGGD